MVNVSAIYVGMHIAGVCTGLGEEHIVPVVKDHTFSSSVHGLSGGFDMAIGSLGTEMDTNPLYVEATIFQANQTGKDKDRI